MDVFSHLGELQHPGGVILTGQTVIYIEAQGSSLN